jgi:hypothetical protein
MVCAWRLASQVAAKKQDSSQEEDVDMSIMDMSVLDEVHS